jgi:uncharacterized SAM-binding protein YcdF (DUF218 family)
MLSRALSRALAAPLARGDAFRRADAIVVLGARLTPEGELSSLLEERVRAGVDLWRRGAAPILCVTGGGPPGRVEADAMAAHALALGVERTALRVERQSLTTEENARYTAALLGAEQCRTVWLVSQPFHLLRARWLFRRHGFEPLAWHVEDSVQYRWPGSGLRWVVREYAAIAALGARTVFRARNASGPAPGRTAGQEARTSKTGPGPRSAP